jgi:hypothetical protein
MVRELLKIRRNGQRGLYAIPTSQPAGGGLPVV